MKIKKLLSLILAAVMLICTLAAGVTVSAAKVTYSDVTESMWSYKDIMYVTENGLMNGTGGSTFSPAVSLTRAMVVTVLYRMEGSPRVEFKDLFLDVKDRLYYSEAVIWAKTHNIVTATSVSEWGEETFSPDRDITRQELATMFVRFAKFKNVITETSATLDKFTDKGEVASWAADAVKWATSVGLINGTGNGDTLSPTGKATREQFAAIIHRYATADFDYNLAFEEPKVFASYTEPEYPLVNDADVYVAVDGNDKNPGTLDKPLATFEAAKAKVRELKKTAKDEIVVAFKAGNYGALNNVTFTPEDGGSESVPIKYCKYGDGDVTFCNGVYIYEDEFTLVTGEEEKMFPATSAGSIYKADLSGRVDKFEFTTRLFTETGLAVEAREPNGRYYKNMTTTVDPWSSIQLQLALPGIVAGFSTVEGMRINGFLRTGWMNDTFDIVSYDPETKVMVLDLENSQNDYWIKYPNYELMYEGRIDDEVFFSNLPDFVDQNGEYWFDNKTSTLYVYKAKGDYAVSGGVEFATIEKGAEYISFVGLDLTTSAGSGIVVYADHFTVDMCKIGNIGGHSAVSAPSLVRYLTVKNSEFYNCVDSCVDIDYAGDDDYAHLKDLVPGNNVIVNNYFHDFTLPSYFSSAVDVSGDIGTYIAHNYFFEGGHGAVRYYRCIGVTIEYNVFDRIMTKTYDFGAVYTVSDYVWRDNVTRYNIFKNIPVYGVYLDAGTCGQEVYGNIFYDCGTAVVQNAGRENYICDNVFIYCYAGVTGGSGMYHHILEGTADTADVSSYGLYAYKPLPGEPMYEEWYKRWPEIYDFSADPADYKNPNCIFNPGSHLSGNASFGCDLVDSNPSHEFNTGGGNVEYTNKENPIFVNPSIGDYRIREDADFFKIPYEEIGRY